FVAVNHGHLIGAELFFVVESWTLNPDPMSPKWFLVQREVIGYRPDAVGNFVDTPFDEATGAGYTLYGFPYGSQVPGLPGVAGPINFGSRLAVCWGDLTSVGLGNRHVFTVDWTNN